MQNLNGIPVNGQGEPSSNVGDADTIESLRAKLAEVEKEKATLHKRFADTQKAYTQGQQKIAELDATNKVLSAKAQEMLSAGLHSAELDELKQIDPDKWYEAKRKLELETQRNFESTLLNASAEARQELIKQQNALLLAEFKQKNPAITDEYINFEVPYRLKDAVDTGKISFAEFLTEVEKYFGKEKVVGGVTHQTLEQPNLTNIGSGEGVSNSSGSAKSFEELYKNANF